ncbi:transcriptional regulator, DeoR family [Cohaesibacter sp. ES.047]|nr:transcriptional regulator, DeoR family [Cohaesibacter sp. ES.047]
MLTNRLRDIVNRVDHAGSITVAELSDQFGVAVETIRRDLRTLEDAGYLRRIHGGATSLNDHISALSFSSRQQESPEAKSVIAQRALPLIREGDVLMLDPSSTAWNLAQALPDMKLTVITNSVRIVFDLVSKPKIEVICVGGHYHEKYGAFLGAVTVSHILDYHADVCFHSCSAYDPETGAWDSNDLNAGVKKAMLRSSRSNVLLCDKAKLGRDGYTLINTVERIDCHVSEEGIQGEVKRRTDQQNKGFHSSP